MLWTPGPLELRALPDLVCFEEWAVCTKGNPARILALMRQSDPEAKANGTLYTAASDLYTALQCANAALINHPGGDCRSDQDIDLAWTALAKARGEKPNAE